jgi:putative endonuclease
MERKSDSKRIGALGEKHVAALLKRNGYRIIGRNVRLSYKEIDIIAENEQYILFVEVKTRSTEKSNLYRPAAAVNGAKQKNLLVAAGMYLRSHLSEEQSRKQPRIDVAEVYVAEGKVERVNYIENAITR